MSLGQDPNEEGKGSNVRGKHTDEETCLNLLRLEAEVARSPEAKWFARESRLVMSRMAIEALWMKVLHKLLDED